MSQLSQTPHNVNNLYAVESYQPISRQTSTISLRSAPLTPVDLVPADQRTLQDENNSLINKVAELQSEKWRLEDELRRAREMIQLAQKQTAAHTEASQKSLLKKPRVSILPKAAKKEPSFFS